MNCKIKNAVFNLIENNTKEELEALQNQLKPMLAIFEFATPADESAQAQRNKIMFMSRCLDIAIGYLEQSQRNEA